MKTLLVHVGEPKTGTTSIQRFLHEHYGSDAPDPATGLWYLPRPPRSAAHHALARALRTPNPAAAFGQTLAALETAPAGTTAVVSAEGLAHFPPHMVMAALSAAMAAHPDWEVWVVLYIRPHIARLLSLYQQQIKAGYATEDFAPYIKTELVRNRLNRTEATIRAFQSLTGSRLIVRPFAREHLADGDVITDFTQEILGRFLPVPPSLPDAGIIQNPARSVPQLSILRHSWQAVGGPPTAPRVGAIRRILRRCAKAVSIDGEARLEIGKNAMDGLRRHFHEDAAAVDRLLFDPPVFAPALSASTPGPRTSSLKLSRWFSEDERAVIKRITRRQIAKSQASIAAADG